MRRPSPISLCCLALLLLPGCAALVTTPYRRPPVEVPATWRHDGGATTIMDDRWWTKFDDPGLTGLIDEALRRNNDLAIAALRVRAAQLQAEQANSNRLPSLKVGGSASQSKNLRSSRETTAYATSIFSSYATDLWGELASSADAARWQAQATEADRANTALALTGTVATYYWQLGYLNRRIELAEASIAYARRTLELVRVQKTAGAATALEILEAEGNVASQEANLTTLVQQRVEARTGLALLFDGPPTGKDSLAANTFEGIRLPDVQAGLPAHLLARRPDVRAAEARLRAALASTDATRAGFYPNIALSGTLGTSSEELARLVRNPIGTLTADLTLPFVQWRDMRRAVKISETEYEQSVLTFRQTLYNALAEVENSLSARQQYREQAEKLARNLDLARQTEEVYRLRYQAGGSPLKSWLDAQEARRQAEIELTTNRYNRLVNHVALVKSLGGGPIVPAVAPEH